MTTSNFRWPGVLLGLALAAATSPADAAAKDKVLIVVSGEGRDQGKARPGYEMDEFAQAYLIFRDNGLDIDVASPRGGAVQADKYDPDEPFNARVLADEDAMRMLDNTRATRDLRSGDYAAVYVVGGKGAMFDLPADPALGGLLSQVYERGGIVSAVCHGPAALVDVRLSDGSMLVTGKAMTGFTNEEEALFGKRWTVEYPFLLEDALRGRGARWDEAPLMMPKVVIDGRLITGQNPYSTPALAEALVKAMGREPVARKPWRDEATMDLVKRLLAGEAEAVRAELVRNHAGYHTQLIGLLGFYQLKAAQGDAAVRDALAVMELAAPYMHEPRLQAGIAEAHWRLGNAARARDLLHALLETSPDMTEARQLLEKIGG